MTMDTTALTPADGSKSGATQTPPLAEACRGPATMPLGILDGPATMPLGILDGAARQPVYTMARQPRPLNRDGTPLSRRFSPPIPAPAPADTNMGLPPAQIPSSAEVTPNVAYRGLGDD